MRRLVLAAALIVASTTAQADLLPPTNPNVPANESRVDFGYITGLTVGNGYVTFVGSANKFANVTAFPTPGISEFCAKMALISQANRVPMIIGFTKLNNGQPNPRVVLSCTLAAATPN